MQLNRLQLRQQLRFFIKQLIQRLNSNFRLAAGIFAIAGAVKAVLAMGIAGGDMTAAGGSRQSPRRHAVGGELIAFVRLVRRQPGGVSQLAARNCQSGRLKEGMSSRRVGKIFIGQDNNRQLIFFRQIEYAEGFSKTLLNIAGSNDDAQEFALRRVQDKSQIGLGGSRRLTGAGAAALGVDHHQRHLRQCGEAERLYHQRKAAAAGGADCPHTGKAGADKHIDGGNFVLRLLKYQPKRRAVISQIGQHAGTGRHRVAGGKFAAGLERAHRNCVVAV